MWRLTSIAILAAGTSLFAARQEAPATPPAAGDAVKTVTGCLRAGDQQNTFVLAVVDDTAKGASAQGDRSTSGSPRATGTTGATPKTITYQLVPEQASVDLQSLVGQRVQATGRVDAGASRSVSEQAQQTSVSPKDVTPHDDSTPVVATSEKTSVEVQHLRVTSIKAAGGRCQ